MAVAELNARFAAYPTDERTPRTSSVSSSDGLYFAPNFPNVTFRIAASRRRCIPRIVLDVATITSSGVCRSEERRVGKECWTWLCPILRQIMRHERCGLRYTHELH